MDFSYMNFEYVNTSNLPNLENLTHLDEVFIKKVISSHNTKNTRGWYTKNRYVIIDSSKKKLFYVVDDWAEVHDEIKDRAIQFLRAAGMSTPCIHILDENKNEVIRITRITSCYAGCSCYIGCCPEWSNEVKIEIVAGKTLQTVGFISQECGFLKPRFKIFDENKEIFLKIVGDRSLLFCCKSDRSFEIVRKNGIVKIGSIAKEYPEFSPQSISKKAFASVKFPLEIQLKAKAILIAALVTLNMMYYE